MVTMVPLLLPFVLCFLLHFISFPHVSTSSTPPYLSLLSFPLPESISPSPSSSSSPSPSSFWGPFRPGHYFGLKSLSPSLPHFSILWTSSPIDNFDSISNHHIRHWAEERDHISYYSYEEIIVGQYAKERIRDKECHVELVIEYIRTNEGFYTKIKIIPLSPIPSTSSSSSPASTSPSSRLLNFMYYLSFNSSHGGSFPVSPDGNHGDITYKINDKTYKLYVQKSHKYSKDVISPFNNLHLTWNNPSHNNQKESISPLSSPHFHSLAASDPHNVENHVESLLSTHFQKQYFYRQSLQNKWEREEKEGKKISQREKEEEWGKKIGSNLVSVLPSYFDSTQNEGKGKKKDNLMIVQHVIPLPVPGTMKGKHSENDDDNDDAKEEGVTVMEFLWKEQEANDEGKERNFDEIVNKEMRKVIERENVKLLSSSSPSSSVILPSLLSHFSAQYHSQLHSSFPSLSLLSPSYISFASHTLSNLIGGIGYWCGTSRELRYTNSSLSKSGLTKMTLKETTPSSCLFSCVPSRSFFPRGFLWDEGFHQLLLHQYDFPLSLTIIDSWLSHVTLRQNEGDKYHYDDGWIPREQIIGDEARERVPQEFQLQKPTIANPPTLIISIGKMITKMVRGKDTFSEGEKDLFLHFLTANFDKIQRNFYWYLRTQNSNLYYLLLNTTGATTSSPSVPSPLLSNISFLLSSSTSFRWADRTKTHCLSSGLDDYPRAKFLPTPLDKKYKEGDSRGVEGNVDIHVWMIAMSKTMANMAKYLSLNGKEGNINGRLSREEYDNLYHTYLSFSLSLSSHLSSLHYSKSTSSYCDYAYRNSTRHMICHNGYVSLFPYLFGSIKMENQENNNNNNDIDSEDDRVALDSILSMMSSKDKMGSDWGVLSLSRKDKQFGSQENYWRGNIWININYLIAAAAKYYGGGGERGKDKWIMAHVSPHVDLWEEEEKGEGWEEKGEVDVLAGKFRTFYSTHRDNLMSNMHSEYESKGYIYEQYDANTGEGKKSHPFTGWSALIVNMMAEVY